MPTIAFHLFQLPTAWKIYLPTQTPRRRGMRRTPRVSSATLCRGGRGVRLSFGRAWQRRARRRSTTPAVRIQSATGGLFLPLRALAHRVHLPHLPTVTMLRRSGQRRGTPSLVAIEFVLWKLWRVRPRFSAVVSAVALGENTFYREHILGHVFQRLCQRSPLAVARSVAIQLARRH